MHRKEMRTLLDTLQLAVGTFLSVMLLSGCVYGVNKVEITHGPLKPIHDKREGIIGVKPFTDERAGDLRKIGTVRSPVGPVGSVELKGDGRLGDIFTGFVVETLQTAGYQTVIMDSSTSGIKFSADEKVPVILDGIITTFWVNTLVAARCEVEVALILRDAENGDGLWATSIYGYGEGTLWTGASSKFEDFIRQAVDEALNQASIEFVSDAFFEKVKRTKSPPAPNTVHY